MNQPQAPEIYQKPLSSIDATGLPPQGTSEFEQALLARIALEYAGKGWSAAAVIDGDVLRVVAVPQKGIAPKKYVLGLLQNGLALFALAEDGFKSRRPKPRVTRAWRRIVRSGPALGTSRGSWAGTMLQHR